MEIIQKHELEDIYRLKDGILLYVIKYKNRKHFSNTKCKKKKIPGISKTYQLLEDVRIYNETFSKGTIIVNGFSVTPTTNPEEFTIELRSSGGTIHGSILSHLQLYQSIEKILVSYIPTTDE